MTQTRITRLLIWVIALTLVMGCIPSLSAQAIPTVDPGAVSTFIAQTAGVAAARTAAAIPSSTATPTLTPTRNTPTSTPTATSTVIFILSTPTRRIPTDANLGGSGSSSDNLACQITRVTPPNGSSFSSRASFTVVWSVKNIGKKNWDRSSVDYLYSGGTKIHKVSGYDLPENVKRGNTIELAVDMRAPKGAGTYSTTWIMQQGDTTFCPMSFTVIVQ